MPAPARHVAVAGLAKGRAVLAERGLKNQWAPRLDGPIVRTIVELMGSFRTDEEIRRVFRERRIFVSKAKLREIRNDPEHSRTIAELREGVLGRLCDISIADKRFRLRCLEELWRENEDPSFRIRILEQARREMDGSGAKVSIQTTMVSEPKMTDEEADKILKRWFGESLQTHAG